MLPLPLNPYKPVDGQGIRYGTSCGSTRLVDDNERLNAGDGCRRPLSRRPPPTWELCSHTPRNSTPPAPSGSGPARCEGEDCSRWLGWCQMSR